MRGEFAFLSRLREALGPYPAGWVGPGDDAAVLDDGLLAAVDTLVDGVHFDLRWQTTTDVGWKALAVNVSDVAAMGGFPLAALASVTLPFESAPSPSGESGLAEAVSAGLRGAARELSCPLVGGDLTSGPSLVVTVAVLGRADRPVLRSGARPGDRLVVTGTVGGPAAALDALRSEGPSVSHPGLARLRRPQPRVRAGLAAATAGASSMIDISDGLASEVHHLCRESGVGALVEEVAIPLGEGATLAHGLAGGDDYELLLTIDDPSRLGDAGVEFTVIGACTAEPEIRLVASSDGRTRPLADQGWSH